MRSASPNYTIVFTDSGLGGLSVMADFFNNVKNRFLNIDILNIVFFNALQQNGNGYNSMPTSEKKIQTFNAALYSINQRYQPDRIAIACNTLSSIYPKTSFAQTQQITLEIISCGRSLISEHLQKYPEIPVIVFATPTTIDSAAYTFDDKNVLSVSGDNLASLIEFNYMMPELKNKVNDMFNQIKIILKDKKTFSLFLGCTHYAYIASLFKEAASEFDFTLHMILDPAEKFNNLLLDTLPVFPDKSPKINLTIESQAEILAEELASISTLLQNKSEELTQKLKNYSRLPETF